jgi:thiol:disulfide interchange protein DsbD
MRISAIAGFLALIGAVAARAEPVKTGHALSDLVPEKTAFTPGETLWFAFHQQLEPGWHVYWKNPGDSGLPLDLKWRLPAGYSAGAVAYPLPEQIAIGPLANFGHHGAPTFLIPVTAPADATVGETVEVGLKAGWLICEEICVPEEAAFTVRAPVAAAAEPHALGARLVAEARAAAPQTAPESRFSASARAIVVETEAPGDRFDSAFFFPETEGAIEPAAKQEMSVADGRLRITLKPGYSIDAAKLETLKGVIVFRGAGDRRFGLNVDPVRSVEDLLAAGPARRSDGAGSGPPQGLALLLLSALAGGVLLNLMPCVFPIIFIKAAALARASEGVPAVARRDGVLYAAGVVAAFAGLGGLLLALRGGGEALGWGFHLQSPSVVLLSAYVLFLVGLNLAGVFHVGTSIQGAGSSLASRRGAAGSFFTGVLAVIVAAPCIGPLLTAPIGAAILLAPACGMLIFIALGLGLAAPYTSLTFAPALGRALPRPGPWMETLRQALAFPVFAGAAYFLWVLAQQTGSSGLARALFGAVVLAFAAWLYERARHAGGRMLALRTIAGAAALAAIAPAANLKIVETAKAAPTYGGLVATPFDPAAIDQLRAEGRPVFVDFTAAWCLTCQVNKLTVLSRASLARAFAEQDVALVIADWTRRDPRITAALAEFGANGVPLYVYYPASGEPKVLPQPLTERTILSILGSERTES